LGAALLVGATAAFSTLPGSGQAKAGTTTTVIEDTATGTTTNKVQYTGSSWTRCGGCSVATSNSSYYYGYTIGNQVTVRFNGTKIKMFGVKESAGGMASVAIDGSVVGNIDTYSASQQAGAIYESPALPAGNHTIVLTILAQKNSASVANVVSFDKAEASLTTGYDAVLYGKAGTFGSLGTSLATGQSLQTKAVDGWGFLPGDSAFFSALAPNGEVVIGTNPQTDNETYATADHMALGIFNPAQNTFRNLVVPTTTGATQVTNPFFSIGGGSVDGIRPVTVNGVQRLAFVSAVNYNGWNTDQYGEYPTLGYLDTTSGSLAYNQGMSKSAGQLRAQGGLNTDACTTNTNIFGQSVASCRGMAEMGVLPLSNKFVVTQYFPDPYNGQNSGRLVVMNTDGSIAASYTYPNIPDGKGGYLTVNPREVDVDPTSTGNLEYFSVIFDVTTDGQQSVFPVQEFAFNRTTNQISVVSKPVVSGQTNSASKTLRYETAQYDSSGNLWLTQAVPNSLEGGQIVVYSKTNGVRKLESSCAAAQPWNGAGWVTTCAPDKVVAGTGTYGQTRSFVQDPTTKTMFAATLNGYLLRVKQTGTGGTLTLTTMAPINLGLDQLVDRTTHYVGFRKGVVDATNRALYVPVVQVANPADCPTWPGATPCAPKELDQWLYKFDLNTLAQ
jgi:hypothetical protein